MGDFVSDVQALARLELKKLSFPQVGIIVSIENLKDGFIDVQPVVSRLGNDLTKSDYAVLKDVPVIFPSTSKSSMQFPLEQGDGVLLLFTQHDCSNYINGNTKTHLPNMYSFASQHHAIAFVGFNSYLQSVHNPTNYKNPFDNKSFNIVHNKNTDKEVKLSLNSDGSITLLAPENKVNVVCNTVIAECEVIDATNALIKTQNDVEIKGVSVYTNMTTHDHNYTDDGHPMITNKPNVK